MTVTVDALKETAAGETRVAVTPPVCSDWGPVKSMSWWNATRVRVLCSRHGPTPTSARVDDAEQLIPRPACTSLTPSRHSAQIMCAIKTLVG